MNLNLHQVVDEEFKDIADDARALLHRFADVVLMKQRRIADAKALLEANGFTVTDPAPTPEPAPAPAA